MPNRPRETRLAAATHKGDLRVEVESPEACRVGEVILLGEREAKMVVDKGSLVFRFPLERDHPAGTIVRPLDDNEFIQAEGDRLCIYRRGQDDDIRFVCHVDLLERSVPERGDLEDEAQDRAYAEDLDVRIQRILDAREATRVQGCGGGGVMIPPLSSVQEWDQPMRARAVGIPVFGNGAAGDTHRECMGEAEPFLRSQGEQGPNGESNLTQQVQVKQEDDFISPLDEYFCRGMDTSGPAAWAKILRDMAMGDLPDVGVLNAREGVREEKWTSFDLRTVKFPSTQTSSVRRAVLIQNFEADFIRAIGIISPSAALYAQAVIAGVQKDLPVYRRRDAKTTQRDWTSKRPEEHCHSRAEAVVNLQLQNVGISQECWDLARMLRHNPPVRLILMTAYHRLLPAKSKEEDDLHQYVKDPAAGDQGAMSTFHKLQLWKGAARRLRQMGGTLPGVTTLVTAFDKILSAFNLNNSRGNWFYQTERNKIPMVDVSPGQAATFFHTVSAVPATGHIRSAHCVHASRRHHYLQLPAGTSAATTTSASVPTDTTSTTIHISFVCD